MTTDALRSLAALLLTVAAYLDRNRKPVRPPRRETRFPGIIADARALGVNRVTLYRVLTGEFTHLAGLRRRYDALKAAQKGAK